MTFITKLGNPYAFGADKLYICPHKPCLQGSCVSRSSWTKEEDSPHHWSLSSNQRWWDEQYCCYYFIFEIGAHIAPCSWGWPCVFNPPASTTRKLGFQEYTNIPGLWGAGDWTQASCMLGGTLSTATFPGLALVFISPVVGLCVCHHSFCYFFSTFLCVCLWVCTPWCVRVKVTGQLVGIGFLLFSGHVGSRNELRSPCLFSPLGWPHILGNTPASARHIRDYIMFITITWWYVPLVGRLPPLLALQKQTNYEEGHVARNWGQLLAHRPQETEAKCASLCLETNHSPMQVIFWGVLLVGFFYFLFFGGELGVGHWPDAP